MRLPLIDGPLSNVAVFVLPILEGDIVVGVRVLNFRENPFPFFSMG